ncbi:MAG TPA: UDP-N-acetylmuramoyl-tripeptide--D-alanyl-D-alanine ligase [Candidatus Didemnitutus sp.]|nr:UDP-N-acetylmuramoyl-tripeptide--D-alanyl-D-alanine ligase [Candidatus Didemnitutus sp.]
MPRFVPEKLAAWTGGHWTHLPGRELTGFNQDTRLLGPGQVFVALRTGKRDGHDFLGDAAARGAAAALVAREIPGSQLAQLVVADPLAAFQRIAREVRREFHGLVIGISGSAGKTSTKELLARLLGGAPGIFATEGNLNNHIGVPLTLTRLDPEVHRAAVVEAGINMPDEMEILAGMIEPDHSVITLVGPAHLEKLGSLDGVATEKAKLPAANRPGGLAVFPVGCWAYESFRSLANPLVLVPANEDMIRVTAPSVRFVVLHRPGRTEITLDDKRKFILRRVSGGMAQNAALALTLASRLGVTDADLQKRLEDWQPAKWRGELQQVGDALIYADFYNANPASMTDAITAFGGMVRPELPRLYVLGCMEELGTGSKEYHRQLGRTVLLRPGDFLFVIGDQAEAVRGGLLENGNDPARISVVSEVAPIRERLSHFKGAVFLKASRRYQLETVLNPEAAAAH